MDRIRILFTLFLPTCTFPVNSNSPASFTACFLTCNQQTTLWPNKTPLILTHRRVSSLYLFPTKLSSHNWCAPTVGHGEVSLKKIELSVHLSSLFRQKWANDQLHPLLVKNDKKRVNALCSHFYSDKRHWVHCFINPFLRIYRDQFHYSLRTRGRLTVGYGLCPLTRPMWQRTQPF